MLIPVLAWLGEAAPSGDVQGWRPRGESRRLTGEEGGEAPGQATLLACPPTSELLCQQLFYTLSFFLSTMCLQPVTALVPAAFILVMAF